MDEKITKTFGNNLCVIKLSIEVEVLIVCMFKFLKILFASTARTFNRMNVKTGYQLAILLSFESFFMRYGKALLVVSAEWIPLGYLELEEIQLVLDECLRMTEAI